MAETVVATGDATAVVVYSHKLFMHAIRACTAAKLMAVGNTPENAQNYVQMFNDLAKGPGETIKYDLIPNIVGPGVLGDNVMAGQEVKWAAFQDSITINQQRQAQLLKGRMSQQRVPYSMRDAAKISLANWWKEMFDIGLMNQLGGNTAQTDVSYTGLVAAVAPDSSHHIYASTATAESDLTSTSFNFTTSLIHKCVAKAQGGLTFPIKPVVINGMEIAGIMFLHPYQVRDLRTNFTAGEWGDIQKAAITGGQITGNPIFTGAIGVLGNVVLHQDSRVPWGDSAQNVVYDPATAANIAHPCNLGAAANGTTSVGRAIFVGAQAAAFAYGAADSIEGKPLRVRWYEELLDAGNQLRVTAGMVYAIKKTVFNSQDYGTIVVSTYAAP